MCKGINFTGSKRVYDIRVIIIIEEFSFRKSFFSLNRLNASGYNSDSAVF